MEDTLDSSTLRFKDIVDKVILDTGKSREDVESIMSAFLANVQECACEQPVNFENFGTFKTEVRKRFYFDINNRAYNENTYTIRPVISFIPSKSFYNMVKRVRKAEIERLQNSNAPPQRKRELR